MDKQITFQEFKNQIDQFKTLQELNDNLGDSIQFDPDSPIPKLGFKTWDMHYQAKCEGFDVDHFIYNKTLSLQGKKAQSSHSNELISVIAEGDSWFKLPIPGFLFPYTIADRIGKNDKFSVYNIAYWGDTLEQMVKDKEYLKVLKDKKPAFFMLSAGGNDIRMRLIAYEYKYRGKWEYSGKRQSGQTWIAHLVNNIADFIHNDIRKGYKTILDDVTKLPELRVLCHGYDYLRIHKPKDRTNEIDTDNDEDKNRWIVPYLDFLGIPADAIDAILKLILDLLNFTIMGVVNSYHTVEFIDLRGVTAKHGWMDDMHPNEDGFKALSDKFIKAMS